MRHLTAKKNIIAPRFLFRIYLLIKQNKNIADYLYFIKDIIKI